MPRVAPKTSRPSSSSGSQLRSAVQAPDRRKRSASGMRRATDRSSPKARSAVVSVSTPGVNPTAMPRRVAAATST